MSYERKTLQILFFSWRFVLYKIIIKKEKDFELKIQKMFEMIQ